MRIFNCLTAVCIALAVTAAAMAQAPLAQDDFSGPALKATWTQDYPTDKPGLLKISDGALDAPPSVCWSLGPKPFSLADQPGGFRLSVDMRLYPQPRYEWKASSEFHPFGFQDRKGGVGSVYARFTVKDYNNDGIVDALEFQTRSADGTRFTTPVPGCNPAADPAMHRYRVDVKPDSVEAYFDGKLMATHTIALGGPLWVVGRNELGGAVLDNFELTAVPLEAATAPGRIEAERPIVSKPAGAAIVDDADASGGKAVKYLGEKKAPISDMTKLTFPAQQSAGVYELKMRLKLEDAFDVGRAWRADVICDKQVVGYGVAQGYYFKGRKGYQDFAVRFALDKPGMTPEVQMYWGFDGWYAPCTSSPKLYLDCLEIAKAADLPPLRVVKVWPNKLRYLRTEQGTVAVVVQNTTGQPLSGRVVVELVHDMNPAVMLSENAVELTAGESRKITVSLTHGQDEAADFGYEVRASTSVNGKTVDSASEFFCVSDNPYAVSTHQGPFSQENDPRDSSRYFFNNGWIRKFREPILSEEEIVTGALEARQSYLTCWEWYSWSPGGCLDMAPKEDFWLDGDTCSRIVGKKKLQMAVAELKKHGIGNISYNLPYGQGMASLKLLQERPEWFTTSKDTKDFTEFGYDAGAFDKLAAFLKKYDLTKIPTNNGYMTPAPERVDCPAYFSPNFALPEAVDYVADQMAQSIRMFGWEGIRWDCGHLNTGMWVGAWQPFLDFYGKPLCNSPEEMVAQTVANIRRFKERMAKECKPFFGFGSNFGSVEETHRYPEMTKELCRDGGWLLDEVSYTYNTPQSAYRFWDKYYAVMSDQGNYVASLGGHYFPFVPTRFNSPYPADRIYVTAFILAGHGHPELMFRNSCFVTGDPAQFAVRFGRYLFDTKLLRVEEPEKIIKVAANRPLWWHRSVWRKMDGGRETLVIHLINPPVSRIIMEDATSALPSPARDISVTCAVPATAKIVKAWALCAESWTADSPARTQAVPLNAKIADGKASVTLPELAIWKTVLFEME